MEGYQILAIRQHPELQDAAASWFHRKWGIPREAYAASMEECLKQQAPVPQWYVAVAGSNAPSFRPAYTSEAKGRPANSQPTHLPYPKGRISACAGESVGLKIIGGLGVIENYFHDRKDLAPNVCAVYVEEEYRGRGIAGRLLGHVCRDMEGKGISTLYLLTGHTSFYERYGWEFLCMAQGYGEEQMSRVYVHRMGERTAGSVYRVSHG